VSSGVQEKETTLQSEIAEKQVELDAARISVQQGREACAGLDARLAELTASLQEQASAHKQELEAQSATVHDAIQLCDEAELAVQSVGELVSVLF
jgi:hypothetical protein